VRRAVAALIIGAAVVTPAEPLSQAPVASPLTIDGEAAMVTIAVRPDRAADFDSLLEKTRTALTRSKNPQRRAQAAGWQVFKSEEMIQGNATYLMRLDPAVRGIDYSLPAIIAEESAGEAAALRQLLGAVVLGQSVIALSPVSIAGLGDAASKTEDAPRASEPRVPVLSFDTAHAAVITILVRQDREADFTTTLGHLGKALQASQSAIRRRQAAGWKVLKGTQLFGANLVYVMSLDPVLPRTEYDPIRLIQESYPADIDAIFKRYRDAYVGQAVSRLTGRVDMSK
jgi:hypothetical protein